MTPMLRRTLVLCCMGFVWASSRRAPAQTTGFALDQFEPSERGSDWFVSDSLDLRGHTRPAVGLDSGWVHQPLVAVDPNGSTRAVLVRDQAVVYIGGSLTVMDRVRFGMDLPASLYGAGNSLGTLGSPDSFSAGDLRLGTDARLVGAHGNAVTLAAGAQVFVPTGSRTAYLSDGSVRIRPRVMAAGEFRRFVYAVGLAFEYRADEHPVPDASLGSSVLFSGSVGVRVLAHTLTLGPEIFGGTVVTRPGGAFGARNTPLEALLGGHYTASSFRVGLGGGPGLTHGIGSPAWRLIASFEWAPGDNHRALNVDGTEMGAAHLEDHRSPALPAPNPSDRDGDTIADTDDACPDVPGAPSPDARLNGCPPDRDGDGLPDSEDACPDVAGVRSSDPKTNGCPVDPDRDHDGIANDVDACPDTAGPASEDRQKNGCPRAFVEGDRIQIAEQVQFRTGTAVLDPSSEETLMAVTKILLDQPEIRHVKVEGHTDSSGNAAQNQRLSEDRANAVRRWLIAHGTSGSRVSSKGFGSTRPLVSNEDEEGRRQNRRVEFHIEGP